MLRISPALFVIVSGKKQQEHSGQGGSHAPEAVFFAAAQAIHGTLWQAGMERAEILDWRKCEQTELKIMKEHLGIPEALCGKCFAVCPYTLRYLRRDYPDLVQAEA